MKLEFSAKYLMKANEHKVCESVTASDELGGQDKAVPDRIE